MSHSWRQLSSSPDAETVVTVGAQRHAAHGRHRTAGGEASRIIS